MPTQCFVNSYTLIPAQCFVKKKFFRLHLLQEKMWKLLLMSWGNENLAKHLAMGVWGMGSGYGSLPKQSNKAIGNRVKNVFSSQCSYHDCLPDRETFWAITFRLPRETSSHTTTTLALDPHELNIDVTVVSILWKALPDISHYNRKDQTVVLPTRRALTTRGQISLTEYLSWKALSQNGRKWHVPLLSNIQKAKKEGM